jgi:hypothetical protein
MGTFGHKIFEDDFAIDIRERYLEMLYEGISNTQATNELIAENRGADIDEEPVFWLSLAATQWEYGRLVEKVKKKALSIIDSGVDQEKWNGDKKRIKELEQLKTKLLAKQPKEKKLVKRRLKTQSGDVFVFKLDDEYFAFGRVLKEYYIAVYQFKSTTNQVPIEEVIQNKVAFVIGCTDDGFYSRKWKIIGNSPLEKLFEEPIWFFHQGMPLHDCRVFNLWQEDDNHLRIIPESECKKMNWGHFGIEQWEAYNTKDIIERLTAKLENRPYIEEFLPDNWETLYFRPGALYYMQL